MPSLPKINWPGCAAKLAAIFPPDRLHPATRALAGEPGAVRGTWTVAFSGGADSLALLLLLWAHWPKKRAKLVALHFNHRLRGKAAEADARFCRRVCQALSLRFRAGRWRRPPRQASEAEAREERFRFFAQEMRTLRAKALWLGQQQDDIAESMLMRLARGSGGAGLAAPRPVQRVAGRIHLRPLLTLKKAELAAGLRRAGAVWCEDSTNETDSYLRNRIRRRVLPAWSRAVHGRDVLAGAALARELIEEDDQALEAWLDRIDPVLPDRTLDLRRLSGCPRAIQRRALHRWLQAQPKAGALSRQGFASLLSAVEANRPGRHSLGVDGFAVIRRERLRFESGSGRTAKSTRK
jgi:tRNA(Ile)-lysidine synthase